MFEYKRRKNIFTSALSILELIYHVTARSVRKTHNNALFSLFMAMLQTIVLAGVFYVMFSLLGVKGSAIRGDFMLYILSGIFLFLTHTKAMGAVAGSEGPASAMMLHAPMSTAVSICSSALSILYIQLLSAALVLFLYHVAVTPVYVFKPVAAVGCFLLAWFSGVAVGMIFLALKPWFPGFVSIGTQIYQRANMLASGKMFVANSLPSFVLPMFTWNPLFHSIDQARGYTFLNYNPHHTSVSYTVYLSLTLIMIGLMGEFYTRKNASASWGARS
ncbi:ABC transporter permease [Cochlodiniinecator piscidefendens]|uniref:ABC transporter permease n=1 Tax=Cochlodiniinecator piscidefendens TaxID=2715756 RepID=UPI00140950BA|nr:ABC transporter permease [Cochlodiniinecator piscidefendens]